MDYFALLPLIILATLYVAAKAIDEAIDVWKKRVTNADLDVIRDVYGQGRALMGLFPATTQDQMVTRLEQYLRVKYPALAGDRARRVIGEALVDMQWMFPAPVVK